MKFSAKRLQEAMDERKLSSKDVARAIGKARQTVNSWALGDSRPNADDLADLAIVLGKPIMFFYANNGDSCQKPHQTAEVAPGATISDKAEG